MKEPLLLFPALTQLPGDERLTIDQVREQYLAAARDKMLLAVFDSVPSMALILNEARQIVYGNRALLEQLSLVKMEEVLTLRPGEVMQCVHTADGGSCGQDEGCRYCGAVSAILESQATRTPVTREARVTVQRQGSPASLDFSVTATPLNIEEHSLTMVYLTDIGAQKRREYLEQIFIHDLLNTINGLSLMTQLLDLHAASPQLQTEVQSVHDHIDMMVEDIRGHKILLSAEQGDLQVEVANVPVDRLVQTALRSVSSLLKISKVTVDYEPVSPFLTVATDPKLARRVVVNALKNAIEASNLGEKVQVAVRGGVPPGGVTISVHNRQEIPPRVVQQIFQRSFSTRGSGRGLGTYSMRLLVESYLGGKVSFSTSATAGTTFFITLPDALPRS